MPLQITNGHTLQPMQECCIHNFRSEEIAVLFNPVFGDLCGQSGKDEALDGDM